MFLTNPFYRVILLLIILSGLLPRAAYAQGAVEVNFFFSSTCPHCAKEKSFLDNLEERYSIIEINRYEASPNRDLLAQFYEEYEVPQDMWGYVPATFVAKRGNGEAFAGKEYWVGFGSGTGQEIEDHIAGLLEEDQESNESDNSDGPGDSSETEGDAPPEAPDEDGAASSTSNKINLPFFGEIDISKSGLLLFSVLIGVVDGFNACAMWALCFLLTFLVASGSRKRIFLVGGTFIFVSGLVYFLFISAWLNMFLLVGYLKAIQVAISVLAIIFGLVCVKDFFAFGKGITFILPKKTRERIGERVKAAADPGLALSVTLVSVALLAAGVNAIELLCTTGFPAVFTKVLAAQQLPALHYYLYLLVYIFFYMLDDFLIFSAVVLSLGAREFPDKYKRVSKLVSGILILILGIIMLVRPELLMFGG
jgi:thiol-disulfide isomerase/thioredoxin